MKTVCNVKEVLFGSLRLWLLGYEPLNIALSGLNDFLGYDTISFPEIGYENVLHGYLFLSFVL